MQRIHRVRLEHRFLKTFSQGWPVKPWWTGFEGLGSSNNGFFGKGDGSVKNISSRS
jgi:hypothetical protein